MHRLHPFDNSWIQLITLPFIPGNPSLSHPGQTTAKSCNFNSCCLTCPRRSLPVLRQEVSLNWAELSAALFIDAVCYAASMDKIQLNESENSYFIRWQFLRGRKTRPLYSKGFARRIGIRCNELKNTAFKLD